MSSILLWFKEDTFYLQYHMKRYAQMIVKLMKSENLYASQGGPIILSQVLHFVFSFNVFVEVIYFLSDLKVMCKADWERVWDGRKSFSTRREIICQMGSKIGCGAWNRSAMGHVQARWCPWSCGKFLCFSCNVDHLPFSASEFVISVTLLFLWSTRSMLAMGDNVEKHLKDPTHQINLQYGLRTGRVCMVSFQIYYVAVYFPVSR